MASAVSSNSSLGEIWPAQLPTFRTIDPPPHLLVPLSLNTNSDNQTISLPVGTRVAAGDTLTRNPTAALHVPIAPHAGKIGQTCEVLLTCGRSVTAVKLIVDAETQADAPTDLSAPGGTALPEWIDFLRRCGVNAYRHASPDLIGQLNQVLSRPIDTVICTILDTDAALRLNASLAALWAEQIVAGIHLLSRLVGAKRASIAIEAQATPIWNAPMRAAARSSQLRLLELSNDYPQADPTLMLYTLSNRRLRPPQLPTRKGVLLLDGAAALAVGRATLGEPMLTAMVAIHDHLQRQAHYLSVPIGTAVGHVLDQCGIHTDRTVIRAGDLLRDQPITVDHVIAHGELTIHITPLELPSNPDPCIRSGWCIDICPTRVQPAVILEAAQRGDSAMAERAGLHACIECGLCSHVCPSRLPLLSAIRLMRESNRS